MVWRVQKCVRLLSYLYMQVVAMSLDVYLGGSVMAHNFFYDVKI